MLVRSQTLDEIDADIAFAWRQLRAARERWAHSANPGSIRAACLAEAYVNRLLEHRHRITH